MNKKRINAYCAICGERIITIDESIITTKPRRGSTICIHTDCYNKEQAELKEKRHDTGKRN